MHVFLVSFLIVKMRRVFKRLYSTIVLFISINSVIIFTLLWCFNEQLAVLINLPILYFKLALIISFFGVFYNAILALLYVKQNAKKVSVTSICVGVFQIFIQLLLVVNLENKAMALVGTLFLNSILTFIIFLFYSKPFFTVNFDFSRARKYMYYSFSQFPSDVSGCLSNLQIGCLLISILVLLVLEFMGLVVL